MVSEEILGWGVVGGKEKINSRRDLFRFDFKGAYKTHFLLNSTPIPGPSFWSRIRQLCIDSYVDNLYEIEDVFYLYPWFGKSVDIIIKAKSFFLVTIFTQRQKSVSEVFKKLEWATGYYK